MESENQYKKGLWTEEEDKILIDYIKVHGKGRWNHISKKTGLRRCGKSCRLRWMNYLNPNVKRGNFTEEEEDLIIRLHNLLGNRWSLIAKRVPGRTDNQVKNYWNTHLTKKLAAKDQNGKLNIKQQSSGVAISGSTVSKAATNSGYSEGTTTDQITVNTGIQKATQVSNTHELTFKDTYTSSFWFYDDPLELTRIRDEFLDGYSFDLG
ncbi:hypothetical protein P3X46_026190 [Hevea brasiliensis]|uniref:Uncharacterized protein n=1 Tax=Hevea brasiliensis TaxID=3981 RepID=A0ABQ9KWY7_HEVBR|nr:transcription factor WER [Hevea brasiliensis]KAJ9152644.1 hypothetical protein P3X46_026190 [Hevea brasiliensis]